MKAKGKLVVFGAGGHAKVVIDIIERQGQYEIIGLIDDAPALQDKVFFGHPVMGTRAGLAALHAQGHRSAIITIGDNATRAKVASFLDQQGWNFVSAVHPAASVGRGATISPGSTVMAGCVINSDASLGNHVIINTGATVDHDCIIGNAVHIAPGCHLCGGVSVGDGTLIGAGAVVIPGVKIGRSAIIGAGSTVIRDVTDGARVSGSPAKSRD